jgi:NO-binding membrane sensor protein with MHYT domain
MSFFDQLFIVNADPSVLVLSNHDPLLVLMSLCIAVFTSAMALQLAGVARDSDSAWWRQVTIATGSLALGAGIWAMHFIGMLAFQLCAEVRFDLDVTLLSMLPSLGKMIRPS